MKIEYFFLFSWNFRRVSDNILNFDIQFGTVYKKKLLQIAKTYFLNIFSEGLISIRYIKNNYLPSILKNTTIFSIKKTTNWKVCAISAILEARKVARKLKISFYRYNKFPIMCIYECTPMKLFECQINYLHLSRIRKINVNFKSAKLEAKSNKLLSRIHSKQFPVFRFPRELL